MENSELLNVILTSSLIAGILSAIVSAIVSIKLKNLDYKNEYYKKILEKRLDAYKFLETQIAVLKSSVLDEDGKGYHLIFAYGENEYHKFQSNLIAAMAYSMWINDQTVDHMEKLNELFFKISRKPMKDDKEVIKLGKENYHAIAGLRKQLEDSVRQDLLNLHDLKKFKKNVRSKGTRLIELEK